MAIHPGYGFLAENADFAEACAAAGLTFIGPDRRSPSGSLATRSRPARSPRMPASRFVPGSGEVTSIEEATAFADKIGYPVMVKAAAGGGGRGIRLVESRDELRRRCGPGDARGAGSLRKPRDLRREEPLSRVRHIEVQIIARPVRQHRPGRRTRVLDPATAPEAHRGVPQHRGLASAPAQPDAGGRAHRAGSELP